MDRSKKIDRSVVRRYEKLLQKTPGGVPAQKGADYHIAPTIGTSRLLIKSLSGRS